MTTRDITTVYKDTLTFSVTVEDYTLIEGDTLKLLIRENDSENNLIDIESVNGVFALSSADSLLLKQTDKHKEYRYAVKLAKASDNSVTTFLRGKLTVENEV